MKVLVGKLVQLLVGVIAPLVLKEVIHALEIMLNADLDNDGHVGFDPKQAGEKVEGQNA